MTAVRVVGLPQPKGIPYRDERYAKHASPQSIRAYLDKARAEHRRAGRVVAWLEQLLASREGGAVAEDPDAGDRLDALVDRLRTPSGHRGPVGRASPGHVTTTAPTASPGRCGR